MSQESPKPTPKAFSSSSEGPSTPGTPVFRISLDKKDKNGVKPPPLLKKWSLAEDRIARTPLRQFFLRGERLIWYEESPRPDLILYDTDTEDEATPLGREAKLALRGMSRPLERRQEPSHLLDLFEEE